jgi:hypothetical protein
MTSLAAMQHLSAIEGTANMPACKWEPIYDRAVGAARRVGKCVPDRHGVGSPGVKVATGTPSRQRAASMMVVANPRGDGERPHAVLAHVAEGRCVKSLRTGSGALGHAPHCLDLRQSSLCVWWSHAFRTTQVAL